MLTIGIEWTKKVVYWQPQLSLETYVDDSEALFTFDIKKR